MLRVFHHAGDAVGALVNVGCCYMKLSEEGRQGGQGVSQNGDDAGFPMSRYVSSLEIQVGYKMGEHACHSLTAYATRLRHAAANGAGGEASLRLHGRRAVLELLLAKWRRRHQNEADTEAAEEADTDDNGRAEVGDADAVAAAKGPRRRAGGGENAGVANLKNASTMPFDEYVRASVTKCGLPEMAEDEWRADLAECEPLLGQWNRVVTFFVLRLLLAPLWEALILLDRLLFLRELNYSASLIPLFDPGLSPRSYALVAVKPRRRAAARESGEADAREGASTVAVADADDISAEAPMDSSRCWGCLPEDCDGDALTRWARDAV